VAALTGSREVYRILSEEEYLAGGAWAEEPRDLAAGRLGRGHAASPHASARGPQSRSWRARRPLRVLAAALVLSIVATVAVLVSRGLRRGTADPRKATARPRRPGDQETTNVARRVRPEARRASHPAARARSAPTAHPDRRSPAPARPSLRLLSGGRPIAESLESDRGPLRAPSAGTSPAHRTGSAATPATATEFGFER
jgi:hypothetical protein